MSLPRNVPSLITADRSAAREDWHYFDNHASTMCDPRIAALMQPYLANFSAGNPSSTHRAGQIARDALEHARSEVAKLVGTGPQNVTFTASATEANNLAILGTAMAARQRGRGNHIVTTAVEHPSVSEPLKHLTSIGFRVTYVPVDPLCRVATDRILAAVTDKTILVSVMSANNEVGTLQPIGEIFNALPISVVKHTDACQSAGRVPINMVEAAADLLTLVGHKMHGPKGIGALCRSPHLDLQPQIMGNHQESGLRAGTENVPGIVGLGAACAIYRVEGGLERDYVMGMRDELQSILLDRLDEVLINGDETNRLPGNLNVSFLGVRSNDLMKAIPTVCVSSGAACTSGRGLPSHVLRAMAYPPERAESSIRFGLSRFNTPAEVRAVGELVVRAVKHLRRSSQFLEV